MSFIEWFNINQGFWAFILSLMSFILSAIAIVYSIINYKNDNKKEFNVFASVMIPNNNKSKIFITVINVGNKPLGLEQISIIYKNCHLSCKCNEKYQSKVLMPSESLHLTFDLETTYLEDIIEAFDYDMLNKNFNIYVTDSYELKHYCKEILPAI